MALKFGNARAVYFTLQPARMRPRLVALPPRPGAREIEVRDHGLEPVVFSGTVRLAAETERELSVQRGAWEAEQGRRGALQAGGETLADVRLLSATFTPAARAVGTRRFLCTGRLTFRQERA